MVRREVAASPVKEEGTRVPEVELMRLADKAEATQTRSLMVVGAIRKINMANRILNSKVRHQDKVANMAASHNKEAMRMDLVPTSSKAIVLCTTTNSWMTISTDCDST